MQLFWAISKGFTFAILLTYFAAQVSATPPPPVVMGDCGINLCVNLEAFSKDGKYEAPEILYTSKGNTEVISVSYHSIERITVEFIKTSEVFCEPKNLNIKLERSSPSSKTYSIFCYIDSEAAPYGIMCVELFADGTDDAVLFPRAVGFKKATVSPTPIFLPQKP